MLEVDIVQGRRISGVEIAEIKGLIEANPQWCRTQLSRFLAERWQWYAASGQLKDMAARSLLLKLHERGLIVLPPRRQEPRLRRPPLTPELFDKVLPDPIVADLSSLRPLSMAFVDPKQPDYRLFQRYLAQHHYLRCPPATTFIPERPAAVPDSIHSAMRSTLLRLIDPGHRHSLICYERENPVLFALAIVADFSGGGTWPVQLRDQCG